MIVTTEAVVLRSRKQGDTSRIVTLYTKDFGLVNVIAKGAREMRSPFSSSLQLFNHISVVFYKKENRDLYLLSKADTLAKTSGIQESLEQLTAASKIAELVQSCMHDEQGDAKLFDLIVAALRHVADDPPHRAAAIALYFYYHFAAHEGFAMKLPPVSHQDERYILNIQTGEIFPSNSSSHSSDDRFILLSGRALGVLLSFSRNAIPGGSVASDAAVTDEVEAVLAKYLRAHIETFKKVKSSLNH